MSPQVPPLFRMGGVWWKPRNVHVSWCLKGWPSNTLFTTGNSISTFTYIYIYMWYNILWFDLGRSGLVRKMIYKWGDTGRAYNWLSFTYRLHIYVSYDSTFSMFIASHERVFVEIQRLLHKSVHIRHVKCANLIKRFHKISLMRNMT